MLVFHDYRARTYIYTSRTYARIYIGHSSANASTISSHFWKKLNDNTRSNPGTSFIFLMTSHTIYVVFYYYITFFIQCYMNILEFHSMLYTQLLIPVILLISTMLMFLCADWNRTSAIYSPTPTLYPEATGCW